MRSSLFNIFSEEARVLPELDGRFTFAGCTRAKDSLFSFSSDSRVLFLGRVLFGLLVLCCTLSAFVLAVEALVFSNGVDSLAFCLLCKNFLEAA